MMKITLCADDFGQNESICQGILRLIFLGRLSAVTCMSNMPTFLKFINPLLDYRAKIDIGLHLNLTQGPSLGHINCFLPIGSCVLYTSLRAFSQATLQTFEDEMKRQIEVFLEATGGHIDFIDGHQHIHCLPLLRDIVLKLYDHYFKDKKVYIRNSFQPLWLSVDWRAKAKAFIVRCLGASAFKAKLKEKNIPHNKLFAGIYAYAPSQADSAFPNIFQQLKEKIKTQSEPILIMCHPALPHDSSSLKTDIMLSVREKEFFYLLSNDLEREGIELVKFTV